MGDKQTEPTEAGKPRYNLRSRATVVSSVPTPHESHEPDLAVEGCTAEQWVSGVRPTEASQTAPSLGFPPWWK